MIYIRYGFATVKPSVYWAVDALCKLHKFSNAPSQHNFERAFLLPCSTASIHCEAAALGVCLMKAMDLAVALVDQHSSWMDLY